MQPCLLVLEPELLLGLVEVGSGHEPAEGHADLRSSSCLASTLMAAYLSGLKKTFFFSCEFVRFVIADFRVENKTQKCCLFIVSQIKPTAI